MQGVPYPADQRLVLAAISNGVIFSMRRTLANAAGGNTERGDHAASQTRQSRFPPPQCPAPAPSFIFPRRARPPTVENLA